MLGHDLEILMPKLRRFARCLYCEQTAADDAVCNSLEAAMAARPIDRDEVSVTEMWLIRHMVSACRDRVAAPASAPRTGKRGSVEAGLESAVSELNFDCRAVVALHIVAGVGLADAAELLDRSLGEIERDLDTARRHIAARAASDADAGDPDTTSSVAGADIPHDPPGASR